MADTKSKILARLELSPATRSTICNDLSIKWTTAFDALESLELKGRVKKEKFKGNPGRGRKRVRYSVDEG